MSKLLGLLCFLLLSQGLGGLVHYFWDWFEVWTLVHRIGFLDGYEVFASVVLLVLGVLVGGVAERFEG
ncbi:hypothetical protein FH609_004365 [Streptomyces sp. 3MP-14]|uniref:Uncharacterized protein n=1 Tax=Streptomyces mimosae TaxID=2586635 RepID=A0A5N6A3Y8_9ACTN|nr:MULTISPECIES: hypothetical protein [Streptomyces]KAB8162962.1 hypothetical protein FH607_020225 [Streptomyces mimosae]KAB8179176.1 hypothetical protein FH609_004365 [Streptomyces sp. 3MP-14]